MPDSAGCSTPINRPWRPGPSSAIHKDLRGSRWQGLVRSSRLCSWSLVRFDRMETAEPAPSLAPSPSLWPLSPQTSQNRPIAPSSCRLTATRALGQAFSVASREGLQNIANTPAALVAFSIASSLLAATTTTAISLLAGLFSGGPWRNNVSCGPSASPPDWCAAQPVRKCWAVS